MFTTIISPAEFKANQQDSWVILDCRFDLMQPEAGRKSYESAHIQNAHYLDLAQDLASPQTTESGRYPLPDLVVFTAKLSNLGIDNNTQVIIYDQKNGFMAAARAWWLLKYLGHESVAVLDGGFEAAKAQGLAIDNHTPVVIPRKFTANIQNHFVVDVDWVVGHLEDSNYQIVDARNAERFAGHDNAMDPVAGHLPNAMNRSCELNIDVNGCFKPKAILQQEFKSLLANNDNVQVVHQCGSGITACHNLLAMQIAGLEMGRLYVGSWSEWIKDPKRPIAKS